MNKSLLVTLILIVTANSTFAGGFQVNLQSTRSSGMGHTGTGLRLGAASGFFNPGALAFGNTEISIGIHLIRANINYREFEPGIYSANSQSGIGTPFAAHISFKPNGTSKFVFGLSVYTPFGSGISYADDWKGQFLLREMALRTIFYQGTISYRVNEKLGIGAAYVFGTGEFSLRRGIPVQYIDGSYGEANLSGAGRGHGINVGVFYQIADNISLGASYRSGVQVNLKGGTAKFDVPSSLSANFPETTFDSRIRLPRVFNWGIGIDVSERTTLSFDVNYVAWSSYDTLGFDFEDNTEQLQDANSPRLYKNVLIARTGIEHNLSKDITVRAGAYYDFTPVQDGYMTPETPDTDKLGICAGLSFIINKKIQLDASFLYITGSERADSNIESGFEGKWKSSAFIGGFSISYKF